MSGRGRSRAARSKQSVTSTRNFDLPANFSTNKNGVSHNSQEQPARFADACAKIQENLQRHLDKVGQTSSNTLADHSDEEPDANIELENEAILLKLKERYQDGEDLVLEGSIEYWSDLLISSSVICLICLETIKHQQSIWSCVNCYCILHLHCIQKWAKDCIVNESSALAWLCPKCRHSYARNELPYQYLCFCGKKESPEFDKWIVPHSCGAICGKPLKHNCGHNCMLLCHPGPCPPCPKTVQARCNCGSKGPLARRCAQKQWSCGQQCTKVLKECGLHKCSLICHAGECPPCGEKRKQACACGAKTELRPCAASEAWRCDRDCRKPLQCGSHYCERGCHGGECGACPRAERRECPCGKTVSKQPCTEQVRPCLDTCEKFLDCGIHRCQQKCHYGSCQECVEMRVKRCRCGAIEREAPCSKELTCQTKCKRMRDCGRHPCNRRCCDEEVTQCQQICGRTLQCKNHKCTSVCHMGPCYPCGVTKDIFCDCGYTKITVPCGRFKQVKPPTCKQPCKKPTECHHSQRQSHNCHPGDCPPCNLRCDLVIDCKKHKCTLKCHDAVLTKIVPEKKKEKSFWDPQEEIRWEKIRKPCMVCQVPLPCLGRHTVYQLTCTMVDRYSCGRACGRTLACSHHTCALPCHLVDDAPDDTSASSECQTCKEVCTNRQRLVKCNHDCIAPCHPGLCPPCSQYVQRKCHCGLVVQYIKCTEWATADEAKRVELLSCKNRCCREMECGHRCVEICHPGPCPVPKACKKRVVVHCACVVYRKVEMRCSARYESEPFLKNVACDAECEAYALKMAADKAKYEERKQQKENESSGEPVMWMPQKKQKNRKRHQSPEVVKASYATMLSDWLRGLHPASYAFVATILVLSIAMYYSF